MINFQSTRGCYWALAVVLLAGKHVLAQDAGREELVVQGSATTPAAVTMDPAMREVLQRLEQAEARIRQLQSSPDPTNDGYASGDPAIPRRTKSVMRRANEYWQNVRDPEIISAAQQTRSEQDPEEQGDSQPDADSEESEKEEPEEEAWYEKLSIRGYSQFRINKITSEDDQGAPAHHAGDSGVGEDESFTVRRSRLVFSGDVSDRLYVYIQPDFASSVPGSPDSTYFAQIRDVYGDVYLDLDKVHRLRVGQSKIPYGWENLQSSSNRIPLDRADGLNTASRNERDLGVFYYWTPEYAQDFFKGVLDMGLKGSGNYGMFGVGVYNGQGGSLEEQNDNLHVVTRLTLPMVFESGQHAEFGVQAYRGHYTVLSSTITPLGLGPGIRPEGTLETGNDDGFLDERIGGTFVWYPQPFGLQAEWNVGRGPSLNEDQTEVIERSLKGGYVMAIYRCETECYGEFLPFVRYSYYRGGYKTVRNAPYAMVDDVEFGLEWQITPQMELVTMYSFNDRTNLDAVNEVGEIPYEQFAGQLLRFQFQINY